MDGESDRERRTDRLLLVEIVLALLLFGLAVGLYWLPAAEEPFLPRWWTWMLLGALFFGVIGLEAWRRRRRSREALAEALAEARTGKG